MLEARLGLSRLDSSLRYIATAINGNDLVLFIVNIVSIYILSIL